MKKLIITTCYLILMVSITAQIEPDWSNSYGENDHTNRDEVHFSLKDAEGNLILIASVEGDSIFSAIEIQKISSNGDLIWRKNFSSNLGLNYDLPLKVDTDEQNNIFIFGFTPNEYNYFGFGYLMKISKDGEQEWLRTLEDIVGSYEHIGLPDLFCGKDGKIHLTASIKSSNTFLSHFFSFDTDGELIGNFHKTGLASASLNVPIGQGNIDEEFYYLVSGSRLLNSIRKINPVDQSDESIPVSYLSFPDSLLSIFNRDMWSTTTLNPVTNEIFITHNVSNFPDRRFLISKLNLKGEITPVYFSPKNYFRDLSDLIFDKDSLIGIGRDLDAYDGIESTFLFKIDKIGNVIQERVLNDLELHIVPQNLKLLNQSLYFILENSTNGKSYLSQTDAFFQNFIRYPISQPVASLFSEKGLFEINNSIVLTGTILKEKYPNDPYLADRKITAQAFDNKLTELAWEYQFDHPGTSYTRLYRVNFDKDGNLVSLSSEAAGPDLAPANHYAPKKHYLRKYDSNGNLIFNVQTMISVSPFDEKNMYFDELGNTFLRGNNSPLILKVSHDGQEQKTLEVGGRPEKLFVDNNNNLNVYVENSLQETKKIVVCDNNLQILKQIPIESELATQFQIPNDNSVYRYLYEPTGPKESIFSLYKNEDLLWSKSTTLSWHPYTLKEIEVNKEKGDLYFSSQPNSFSNKLHFLSFDGTQYKYLEDPCGSTIFNLYSFENGNILGISENRDCLYDQNLNRLGNTNFLVGNSFSNFNIGTHLIQIKEGVLHVFDYNGNKKLTLSNPSFSTATGSNDMSSNFSVAQANNYGNFFPVHGGTEFGFRWFRGVLDYFNLKNHHDFSIPSSTSTLSKNENQLSVFPNPNSGGHLFLQLSEANQCNNTNVSIRDISGKDVLNQKVDWIENGIQIELNDMAKGIYVITVLCEDSTWSQRFVLN